MDKNSVVLFFEKIWPTTKRIIDGIFYFIFNLIRTIVRIGINQIRDF